MKLTRNIAVLIASLLLLGACATVTPAQREAREAATARATKGKALFEEKCRTVAGERIYRTVADVEGILLLKVRPPAGEREWADPMWPGAAFALESRGDGYIATFLGFEYAPGNGLTGKPGVITRERRGYIASDRRPGGVPGYRYVDVVQQDGKAVRYTESKREVTTTSNVLRGGDGKTKYLVEQWVLDKSEPTPPLPRYGVTFEDHVIREERMLGLASSTVRVVDLQTNEVLGELKRYAWSPGRASAANPSPWLTAYKCPGHAVGSNAATRKFVDQVLVPRKE